MEPYASQLSGSSLGAPLYSAKSTSCWTKGAIAKACGALVAVLLLAAAIGLGLYFVDDDAADGASGGGGGAGRGNDGAPGTGTTGGAGRTRRDPSGKVREEIERPDGSTGYKATDEEIAARKPIFTNPVTEVDPSLYHWPYGDMLGDTFMFYEIQRSGEIETADSRVPWRGNHLLDDGDDVGEDLTGGHYEAGNRLKITFPESYFTSRLAWSCLYQNTLYGTVSYGGESLLHWCVREVRWAASWLVKTQLWEGKAAGAKRPSAWGAKDRMVVQVGTLEDFNCYRRAENMPTDDARCPKSARATMLANATHPASDAASYAAAASLAAAALLDLAGEESDKALVGELITSSEAFYDFATQYNETAMTWSPTVAETYPLPNSDQSVLFAEAMFAYLKSCASSALAVCDKEASQVWLDMAVDHYQYRVLDQPDRHKEHMLSYWGNPDYDTALLLIMASGNTSAAQPQVKRLAEFVTTYVQADPDDPYVGTSPLGMRYHSDEEWAFLRISSATAFTAATFASLGIGSQDFRDLAYCYARSQLGYIVGETTELSYVHGFGRNFITQLHHRDSTCTLEEDSDVLAENVCDQGEGQTRKFYDEEAPNSYIVPGAVVGGPNKADQYANARIDYQRSEVALDYNTLYTTALAALASAPPAFWEKADTWCPEAMPTYPWGKALAAQDAFRAADLTPNPMGELSEDEPTAQFGPPGEVPESSLGAPPPPEIVEEEERPRNSIDPDA